MEPIIAQIHALASTADEAGKKKILQQLRSVSFDDLEDPRDYVQRINYRVSLPFLFLSNFLRWVND
jgi:demethylsterigmatocystin 6-O-methyltransferase